MEFKQEFQFAVVSSSNLETGEPVIHSSHPQLPVLSHPNNFGGSDC